jgi:hypothetical protein
MVVGTKRVSVKPTATQAMVEVHDTPLRMLDVTPVGLGVV